MSIFEVLGLKFIELFDGESGVTDQFSEQAETKFIMPSHLPSPRRGEGWGDGGMKLIFYLMLTDYSLINYG